MSSSKKKKNSSHSPDIKKTGVVQLHADGYGFLISEVRGEKDVFIPAHATGGAMDGDRVEALILSHAHRKRKEGKILKVLSRAHEQLVGKFQKNEKGSFVISEKRGGSLKIHLSKNWATPILPDEAVIVKITQYPEEGKLLEGEIVKVLGMRQDPKTETEIIITEHRLPTLFPDSVLHEARHLDETISSAEWEKRKDLRNYPIITIDGENARDFDDAILVQRIPEGFKLFVAIADVSHFVHPATDLNTEALTRATSVYLPTQCIPMLPEELSNHLCSLVPDRDRLCFVAELDFDRQGHKINSSFYKGVIRSASRQTYTQIHRMMEGDLDLRKRHASLVPHLEVAFELYESLRAMRLKRGSIDFDLPEPEIVLDVEEGIATSIIKSHRTSAHMLIEECMIAANEAVAEFIEEKKIPMIYRIHDTPDPEKLGDFKILLHNLGHALPAVDHITPKDLSKVVREVHGKPYKRLVNTLLLRSLKQAIYSTENVGHFGLASKSYTHFTSPIRRYPDLVVHRLLEETLLKSSKKQKKGDSSQALDRLAEIAGHCSKMERKSMKAEWEARDLHVALFMKDKVGEEFEGVISSVTHFGIFVELMTYFVEGLVPLQTFMGDSYEFIEKQHELRGRAHKKRFKIGDSVRIKVVKVDIEKRRLDFILIPETSHT